MLEETNFVKHETEWRRGMGNNQEYNYLNIRCHTVSDIYWTIDDNDPDYSSWRDSTYWFNPKDYKIYTPNQIRGGFDKNHCKIRGNR